MVLRLPSEIMLQVAGLVSVRPLRTVSPGVVGKSRASNVPPASQAISAADALVVMLTAIASSNPGAKMIMDRLNCLGSANLALRIKPRAA